MPDGPLSVLAERLRSRGVPSLSGLIARLGEAEDYESFVALVKEFLPERKTDILSQSTPQAQVAAFASHFEDRYFPLDDAFKLGDIEGYDELTRGIPIIPLGLSYDDYQFIAADWRSGLQLMTYLVEDPIGGERAALAEACEEYVPSSLLHQVPEEGIRPEDLKSLLDETRFRGLVDWANVIWHDTGNFFLDIDLEELCSAGPPEWNPEAVEHLTTEWQQAEVIQVRILNLAEVLEQDPPARLEELLKLLERR